METSHILIRSKIARMPFVMKNVPRVISKILFLLFSLYWMFRVFYMHASYIFLIMGLFFLFWSITIIIYPFAAYKKTHYLISKNYLESKTLFKRTIIPLEKITGAEIQRSKIDHKDHSAKIEIAYRAGDEKDSYEEYLDLWGLENYHEFESHLSKHIHEQK